VRPAWECAREWIAVRVLTGLWANPAVQWLHLWPNFVVCISSLSRPTSAAHPMGGVHGHGLLDRGAAPWAKPTGKHHGQTRPANALVCMRVRARLCLRVNANASGCSSPPFFSFDHSSSSSRETTPSIPDITAHPCWRGHESTASVAKPGAVRLLVSVSPCSIWAVWRLGCLIQQSALPRACSTKRRHRSELWSHTVHPIGDATWMAE